MCVYRVPPVSQDPLVSLEDRDTLVCPDPGETVVSPVELEAWCVQQCDTHMNTTEHCNMSNANANRALVSAHLVYELPQLPPLMSVCVCVCVFLRRESLVELAPLDLLDPVDPLETSACPV